MVDDWQIKDNIFIKSNSIPLRSIFRMYKLDINEYNNKCRCPFPFHADSSPSFIYYHLSNSFYCFGCKNGGGSLQFVALMDNLPKIEAAKKLLTNFESNSGDCLKLDTTLGERRDLCFSFSKMINTFLSKNISNLEAIKYADNISSVFDTITQKHYLEIDGLKLLIRKLKNRLEGF